eukprot:1787134-Pyramimonas_sp.AAC.1
MKSRLLPIPNKISNEFLGDQKLKRNLPQNRPAKLRAARGAVAKHNFMVVECCVIGAMLIGAARAFGRSA